MRFPCTKCGLCCQNIGKVEVLQKLDRGDGTCIHFNPSHNCDIYEDRPLMCQIDTGFKTLFSSLMTKSEYYQKNAHACNELQKEACMPINFRVVLK